MNTSPYHLFTLSLSLVQHFSHCLPVCLSVSVYVSLSLFSRFLPPLCHTLACRLNSGSRTKAERIRQSTFPAFTSSSSYWYLFSLHPPPGRLFYFPLFVFSPHVDPLLACYYRMLVARLLAVVRFPARSRGQRRILRVRVVQARDCRGGSALRVSLSPFSPSADFSPESKDKRGGRRITLVRLRNFERSRMIALVLISDHHRS